MGSATHASLSRREREVTNILYRLGEVSAQVIQEELQDPPSYSAVRALLATMIDKDLLVHRKESRHYLYRPAISEANARRAAVSEVIGTFFDGKAANLVSSLLDTSAQRLSRSEIDQIRHLITTWEP